MYLHFLYVCNRVNIRHLTQVVMKSVTVIVTVLNSRSCTSQSQAAKCKWRALRHTCLLLLSVLGGMPASHQGMQARLFFVVDI